MSDVELFLLGRTDVVGLIGELIALSVKLRVLVTGGRVPRDLIFEPGTDVLQARQMVQEHLTQAHSLPQVGTSLTENS
jgi:Cu/Ag efflux pump CusA